MDKSMIKGIAVGGLAMVVLGSGAVTGYKTFTQPKLADVVAVKEVMETVTTPRERCETVQVQHQAPVKDQNRIAGTVVGGLAGGLLGSTIGKGDGKKLATVAGAAAGGYAGNQVQQKVAGYNVTYRLDGKEGTVRTSFKPGATLPVRDGKVVTTPPADTKA
jgi:uncharacterized protein YcfJ